MNLICELCQAIFLHYKIEPVVLHNKSYNYTPYEEDTKYDLFVQNS